MILKASVLGPELFSFFFAVGLNRLEAAGNGLIQLGQPLYQRMPDITWL